MECVMTAIYLFDWGNTLMVDLPDQQGKMYQWDTVQVVDGAEALLKSLAATCRVYIATNADDSAEADVRKAFERVGLDRYIRGYFCKESLGIEKGSPQFYRKIAAELGVEPDALIMVGDTLDKDVLPAIEAGLNAVWFNREKAETASAYQQIRHLSELLEG
jgi:putative hydrolase of the HAD superfamily